MARLLSLFLAFLILVPAIEAKRNTDRIYKKDGTVYEGKIKTIADGKVYIDPVGFIPLIDVKIKDIERIEYADGRKGRFDKDGKLILKEPDTVQFPAQSRSRVVRKLNPYRPFVLVSGLAALYAYDKFRTASDLYEAASEFDRTAEVADKVGMDSRELRFQAQECYSQARRDRILGILSAAISVGAFIVAYSDGDMIDHEEASLKLRFEPKALKVAYICHFK